MASVSKKPNRTTVDALKVLMRRLNKETRERKLQRVAYLVHLQDGQLKLNGRLAMLHEVDAALAELRAESPVSKP